MPETTPKTVPPLADLAKQFLSQKTPAGVADQSSNQGDGPPDLVSETQNFLQQSRANLQTKKDKDAADVQAQAVANTKKLVLPKMEPSLIGKVASVLPGNAPQLPPKSDAERAALANQAARIDPIEAASRARAGAPLEKNTGVEEQFNRDLQTGSRNMPIPAFTDPTPEKSFQPGIRKSTVGELTDLAGEYLNRPDIPKTRTQAFFAGATSDAVNAINDMFLSPLGLTATALGATETVALARAGKLGGEALKLAQDYEAMRAAGASGAELGDVANKMKQAIATTAEAQKVATAGKVAGQGAAGAFGAQGATSVVEGVKEKNPQKVVQGAAQILLGAAALHGAARAGGAEGAVKSETAAKVAETAQEAPTATRTAQIPPEAAEQPGAVAAPEMAPPAPQPQIRVPFTKRVRPGEKAVTGAETNPATVEPVAPTKEGIAAEAQKVIAQLREKPADAVRTPPEPPTSASAPSTEAAKPEVVERRLQTSTGTPPEGTAERRLLPGPPPEQNRLLMEYRRKLNAPGTTPEEKAVLESQIADISGTEGALRIGGGGEEMAQQIRAARDQSSAQPISKAPLTPEVRADAEQEIRAASDLASTFERPGRYFASQGQTDEMIPQRSQSSAKGIQAGGVWYGVGSARNMIADQYPWFGQIKHGPGKLAELAAKRKGAEYERLVQTVGEHIQREKESAAPVMAEFAPQLKSLADEIDGHDEELSSTLAQLANGDGRGFKNLRQYVEQKVSDATEAAQFYRLIDAAAKEAREASVESAPQSPDELRKETSTSQEALPGFESAIKEQKASAETVRGEKLSAEVKRPLGDINRAAGEMESKSPLFRGTAASPQGELLSATPVEKRATLAASEATPGQTVRFKGSKGVIREVRGSQVGFQARGSDTIQYLDSDAEVEPVAEKPTPTETAVAPEKPSLTGTTAYSNPLFDPEVWKTTLGYLQPADAAGQPNLRARTGELARKQAVLQEKLKKERSRWRGRSDADMLAFADLIENGEADRKTRGVTLKPKTEALLDKGKKSITAADKNLATTLRTLLDEGRTSVQKLGTGKLKNFIENYFPHIWEQKGTKLGAALGQIMGKRPLEGAKSFLKKREIPTTAEGFDRDLKPVTTNPVDMAILKMHEMNRFVMAHRLLDDLKAAKTAQFVGFAEKPPEGWKPLDDKVFTVFGNPDIPVKEYYDEAVWDALQTLAKNLNINHTRTINIGGTRLGYAQPGGRVVTRFATPEAVIAHEIGHQMDWKYGLKGKLVKVSPYKEELRKLVDLKWEGKKAEDVPASFRQYVRKGEEKMATMIEALIHAPDKFKAVAPQTWKFLQDFIANKPELKPLMDVKPSLKFGVRSSTVNAGGMVIHGRYYAPEEVAQPINRYVASGLKGVPLYDLLRTFGNGLNQVQLGLSGFHLGTTSLNAVISQYALATKQAARGQLIKAAGNLIAAPTAPIRNLIQGGRVAKNYLRPDQVKKYAATAKALEQAGGRVGMGEEYIDNAVEKMLQSFANKKYFKGMLQMIPAAVEAQAIPVLKWTVPRMKLGAFHDLAADILARGQKKGWSPEQIRSELQKSWDSIDNRFGQVVYDNLNWNKVAKDLAFIGVRSVGWNYGTWRELGGGLKDAAAQAGRFLNGKGFDVTDRMAYTFMLPLTIAALGALYMYAHTGKWPQNIKDYFYPKNGKLEEDGTEARSALPSYMKDVFSFSKHPVDTTLHKINPALSVILEMVDNKDYYGNEIRNTDDPVMAQLWQAVSHVGGSFLPFTVRTAQKQKELGEKGIAPKVETFMGVTPAPRAIERTDAEAMAHDLIQRRAPAGAHTAAEQKKRQRIFQLEQDIRDKTLTVDALKQKLAKGEVTKDDIMAVTKRLTTPGLVRQFKELSIPEALKVWEVASPKERSELKVLLAEKAAHGLPKMTREEMNTYIPLLRQALTGSKPATQESGTSKLRIPFMNRPTAKPTAEAR